MNIILDSNNVGQFIGADFQVTDTCILFSDGAVCNDLNASNITVIDADPPAPPLGGVWKWENSAWVCINQEAVDQYNAQQTAAFNKEQSNKRLAAYTLEADPIYFKAQRGEATMAEWEAKVAEIKTRYPYKV
jgi:hypothetical protein